jgi:hypothetical protein
MGKELWAVSIIVFVVDMRREGARVTTYAEYSHDHVIESKQSDHATGD